MDENLDELSGFIGDNEFEFIIGFSSGELFIDVVESVTVFFVTNEVKNGSVNGDNGLKIGFYI